MTVNIAKTSAQSLKVGDVIVFEYSPKKTFAGAVEAFYKTTLTDEGLAIYSMTIRSVAERCGYSICEFEVRADHKVEIITETL